MKTVALLVSAIVALAFAQGMHYNYTWKAQLWAQIPIIIAALYLYNFHGINDSLDIFSFSQAFFYPISMIIIHLANKLRTNSV